MIALEKNCDVAVLQAIRKGILKLVDDNRHFNCILCSKDISGDDQALQHIQGKPHKKREDAYKGNNVAFRNITTDSYKAPTPSSAFVVAYEDNVRIALKEKIITEKDKRFLFFCNACQSEVSGDIGAHLDGRDHINSGICWVIENPRIFPPSLKRHVPDIVLEAARRGKVEILPSPKNTFRCVECNRNVAGISPLYIHLESHQTTAVNSTFALEPRVQENKMNFTDKTLNDKTNIVLKGDDQYKCICCEVDISGEKQVQDHLAGARHEKKLKRQLSQATSPAATNGNVEIIKYRPTSYSATGNTDNDGCLPQMDVNITGLARKLMKNLTVSKNETYILRSKPPGFVLVFNYLFKNEPKAYREGASEDSEAIKLAFQKLKYRVEVYEDKTKDETLKIVEDLKNGEILKIVDSFICVILSHGKRNMKFHTIGLNLMDLDEIRHLFKNSSCPNLRGKPKIFFANFCRGLDSERDLRSDSMDEVEYDSITDAPTDMVTFHASINSFKALRSPMAGTIFIKSLCNTLNSSSSLELMDDFRRKFFKEMDENGGSTPEVQDYKFAKKFYFKP